jgi:ureidoacrylate peracid hydrolase
MNQQRASNLSRRNVIAMIGATAAASFAGDAVAQSASAQPSKTSTAKSNGRLVQMDAQVQAIEIDTAKTAVIVVDMQNDFASKGGMLDRAGIPITMIQQVVTPTARVLTAARRADIPVIYLKMAFRPDLSDMGIPDSPNWRAHHKILVGTTLRDLNVGKTIRAPNGAESRILVRDTWNTDILDELKPESSDVIIYKNRYSGFYQTELDKTLSVLGVRYLIVTGCTTSVCVESTIRDAMFRDYSPVLLEDCTAEPLGYGLSRSNYEASLLLIRGMGWVTNSEAFIRAVQSVSSGRKSEKG